MKQPRRPLPRTLSELSELTSHALNILSILFFSLLNILVWHLYSPKIPFASILPLFVSQKSF